MAGRRRSPAPRRSRKGLIFGILGLVVALAAGAVGYLYLTRDQGTAASDPGAPVVTSTSAAKPSVADPAPAAPTLNIAPMQNSKKAPTPQGVAKALAAVTNDKNLASFAGQVLDGETGKVLWSKDPSSAQVPASAQKLITGTALLTSLKDPNQRLLTRVAQGDQEGDIIFIGGGDVTLSARQTGSASVYAGAPTVADLAAQVKASGVPVKRIVLDTSYWQGAEIAPGWKLEDIRGSAQSRQGYITKMQALMVDGDRQNPANENSVRTGEPAMTAGKALARALGNADLPIVDGEAPPNPKIIATVQSQPMSILLAQALQHSDNVLAESLAREVAGAKGAPRSFEGATAAMILSLQDLKIDTINVEIYDGSGMSDKNRVTPDVLAQVVRLAVNGKNPQLSYLISGLPVAGVSGTLSAAPPYLRFDDERSKPAAGWVRAKTGSLGSTYVLAGYTPDVDGRVLVFSLVSNASIPGPDKGTRPAQDYFAAILRQCGCQS